MTLTGRGDRFHDHQRIENDQRTPSQRDRDRVLYSEAFRRLQGVTQVLSSGDGTVVHNRLTHSLKVGQVSRRIAERLINDHKDNLRLIDDLGGLDPDVCEAAALAHDLGHPPFGHIAEAQLQHLTEDSGHFEGNAQSFRILNKIEPHHSTYRGLNLTRATLAAVIKYPYSRTSARELGHKKYSYYSQSEKREYDFARILCDCKDTEKTLEAEIMDFADDITFAIHDTEDFYRAGLIPLHLLGRLDAVRETDESNRLFSDIEMRWSKRNEPLKQECKVALLDVLDLLCQRSTYKGSQEDRINLKIATSSLIFRWIQKGISLNKNYALGSSRVIFDPKINMQITMLKELIWTYVMDKPSLAHQQYGHKKIIKEIFEFFLNTLNDGDGRRSIPLQFHELIDSRNINEEPDHRIAADIICCLTDAQALTLYRRITGIDPGGILRT